MATLVTQFAPIRRADGSTGSTQTCAVDPEAAGDGVNGAAAAAGGGLLVVPAGSVPGRMVAVRAGQVVVVPIRAA
jgi:hypothetical protein